MPVLSPDERDHFLNRFGDFEDGVITGIRISIPRRDIEARKAVIDILAMDNETCTAEIEWKLIQFTVENITEYRFNFNLSEQLILTCGADVIFYNGEVIVDLDPPFERPGDADRARRESAQYICGRSLSYAVSNGPFI